MVTAFAREEGYLQRSSTSTPWKTRAAVELMFIAFPLADNHRRPASRAIHTCDKQLSRFALGDHYCSHRAFTAITVSPITANQLMILELGYGLNFITLRTQFSIAFL